MLFISASKEMALEQNIKDLQAQNAQFQQMIVALAKGQEDLKALILKDKRKKPTGLVNLGRRIKGPARRASELVDSSKEGNNQEEETREEDSSPKEYDDESDYDEEQYPPAD